MFQTYLKLILIGVSAIPNADGALRSGLPAPLTAADSAQVARRVATTARLAAEEFGLGVRDGKVVLAPEVEEARLFLTEARRAAGQLPASHAGRVQAALAEMIAMVDRTAPPDSLAGRVEGLVAMLTRELGVTLDQLPAGNPSLARGETIYRSQCASCHGQAGQGDGPAAAGLDPAPARLADPIFFKDASPLDFYRRITIGVAGTAMPSYEAGLTVEDRWAVALYASTLRLPAPTGKAPAHLAAFAATATIGDAALLDSLGSTDLALLAATRAAGGTGRRDFAPIFAQVRARLDSAFSLAGNGRTEEARGAALGAYMAFEAVERELRIKDAALVLRAEKAFAEARDASDPTRIAAVREELARTLERSERVIGTTLTPISLFVQSFLILIREGLEAILLIGALIAFLVKMGAGDRRRDIHIGVAAAIGLSIVTAILIETLFRLGPEHQEALEGATMVVATVMLFSVSYWLVSKMEMARWREFVRSKLSDALSKRSMVALASVAFLAVYREGFETVLFYKALAVSAGSSAAAAPIVGGFVVAAVGLGIIYVAINRFGVRLPLKPFFAVTSGFLYLMAFVFAGTAVAELQEGGFLPITPIPGMFRAPTFGIYPTVESVGAQALLVVLAVAALAWTFVISPRRARSVAAPTLVERPVVKRQSNPKRVRARAGG